LCDCVADQLSVHDVGQAAFQAAHGFVVIFAFGSFPQVIGPAGGVVADLGEGHDVQAEIELAIAGAGKPVAHHLAGGHALCGSTATTTRSSDILVTATGTNLSLPRHNSKARRAHQLSATQASLQPLPARAAVTGLASQ
jgi:hypothetical protein